MKVASDEKNFIKKWDPYKKKANVIILGNSWNDANYLWEDC